MENEQSTQQGLFKQKKKKFYQTIKQHFMDEMKMHFSLF